MMKPSDMIDGWRLWTTMARMGMEAQMVIAMRVWGSFGMWNLGPREHHRMVSEKIVAAQKAGTAALAAAMKGQGPARIGLAAVTPVQRRTRMNTRRLTKRGPGPGR